MEFIVCGIEGIVIAVAADDENGLGFRAL